MCSPGLHARAAAVLLVSAAVFAAALGALTLLVLGGGPAPGSGVRLRYVGEVYALPTGGARTYRLRLPDGWGVADEPAERWVQVALERSCEAAVLSALMLTPTARPGTLTERVSALLWQIRGREAEPGATLTTALRVGRRHATVATDLTARVAVLAVPEPSGGRRAAVAVVVEGTPGPGPGGDHRTVRLTPEHLGGLVAGVEAAAPGAG